jgi:hypothetical protein
VSTVPSGAIAPREPVRPATPDRIPAILDLIASAATWLRNAKDANQWARPWPDQQSRGRRIVYRLSIAQTWIQESLDVAVGENSYCTNSEINRWSGYDSAGYHGQGSRYAALAETGGYDTTWNQGRWLCGQQYCGVNESHSTAWLPFLSQVHLRWGRRVKGVIRGCRKKLRRLAGKVERLRARVLGLLTAARAEKRVITVFNVRPVTEFNLAVELIRPSRSHRHNHEPADDSILLPTASVRIVCGTH